MRQVLGFGKKPAPVPAASEGSTGSGDPPGSVLELRQELGALLIDLDDDHVLTLRHLVHVYEELGRGQWPGVEALPARVLRKARIQAEMLTSLEPSQVLDAFVQRLQAVEAAASARDGEKPPAARRALPREEPPHVEVSDTSFEEYELTERSWIGTVPGSLGQPER